MAQIIHSCLKNQKFLTLNLLKENSSDSPTDHDLDKTHDWLGFKTERKGIQYKQ